MASIKSTGRSTSYTAISEQSGKHNEANDCSVISVAAATGKPYAWVHAELKKLGRKDRQGTFLCDCLTVIHKAGFTARKIEKREIIDLYPGNHKNLQTVTSHHPERFWKVWPAKKTFFCYTAEHFLTIVNGETVCWSKGHALRIKSMYEITKTKQGE